MHQADMQNGGSFARLPPAPTTLCYLRLSVATAVGLLSVASVAGRPSPGRVALNELSAPALTIHDVTSSRQIRTFTAQAPLHKNTADLPASDYNHRDFRTDVKRDAM
jgi:hypothetical protein